MGFQLPGFLDPAAYFKGGAKFLDEIAKPPAAVRKPAPKPRKPKGQRKIQIKTPSGRTSELELAEEVASNKEVLDLRHDQKVALRHVEDRVGENEERFEKLLEMLKTKEVIEEQKGGLFAQGNDSAPPSWVPMVPIAAVITDDLFDSSVPAALGLGGLGLLRVMSGAPFSLVDALAFGLGGVVVFRKYQEGNLVVSSVRNGDS
ncbi:MAG: hypothetical protein GY822_16530 [Deltaproteobacteria bacterium]|nr:hypothetical protein [Deltaproteobacteria bacterium]